jgi:hypothetical protein
VRPLAETPVIEGLTWPTIKWAAEMLFKEKREKSIKIEIRKKDFMILG